MEFGVIFFCGGLTFIDFYNTFDHLRTPPNILFSQIAPRFCNGDGQTSSRPAKLRDCK
jgi:hypothetical protein